MHGRGGQGVKTAAQIIGRAAFLSGYYIQDFAMYGAERRGAPVVSFVRLDSKPILTRGYITEPDYVMVLDDTLDLKSMLKDCSESVLIINTEKPKKTFTKKVKKVYTIDATSVALNTIGKPIFNTVMIGAFVKIFSRISLKNTEKAIREELSKHPELIKQNIDAIKEAGKQVK